MIQVAKLTASDGEAYDFFGKSVSISGDTIVVGAYGDDDNGICTGSAYVFEKPDSGWTSTTQNAKLTASDGEASDRFGRSVSISGDTIVVGAHLDDDNDTDSGAAYLFEKPDSGGWTSTTQDAKLTASDGEAYGYFGVSVSISGDTIVVGAHNLNDFSANDFAGGSAYIFEKTGPNWPLNMTETSKLTASDGRSGDRFGSSVSISGE